MLKLSAEKIYEGKRTAEVQVFQGDYYAGMLTVVAEHADELVGLLNAATELLEIVDGLPDFSAFKVSEALAKAKGVT